MKYLQVHFTGNLVSREIKISMSLGKQLGSLQIARKRNKAELNLLILRNRVAFADVIYYSSVLY